MKVRTQHTAEGVFVLIETATRSLSHWVGDGIAPALSLREDAIAMRLKAERLVSRAAILEDAAKTLE